LMGGAAPRSFASRHASTDKSVMDVSQIAEANGAQRQWDGRR
jgi:hypothetical protein